MWEVVRCVWGGGGEVRELKVSRASGWSEVSIQRKQQILSCLIGELGAELNYLGKVIPFLLRSKM